MKRAHGQLSSNLKNSGHVNSDVRSHKGSGHCGPTQAAGARAGSNQPHMLLDTQVWASDADLSARVGRKGVGVRKRLDIGGGGGQCQ